MAQKTPLPGTDIRQLARACSRPAGRLGLCAPARTGWRAILIQGERSRSFSCGPIALRENYGFSLRQVNRLAQSA
ncbi:MAG: hypothetical protein ACYCUE_09780 [Steroidobacteraceae bacterium]